VGAKGEERNLTEEPQCASAAQPNNQGCACLAELRCVEIQASARRTYAAVDETRALRRRAKDEDSATKP
jgi:hypothetical protein